MTRLTVKTGVAAGTREDVPTEFLAKMLVSGGFVDEGRRVVSDERDETEGVLREMASEAAMVLTTGRTGLGACDSTPEATKAVIEREAPGLAELTRAAGIL